MISFIRSNQDPMLVMLMSTLILATTGQPFGQHIGMISLHASVAKLPVVVNCSVVYRQCGRHSRMNIDTPTLVV